MKRSVLTVVALAAVIFAWAAPASAQPTVQAQPEAPRLPLTFSVDMHRQWHLDRGYRLFSGDRSNGDGGVSVLYDVRRLGSGTLSLGAGLHGNDLTGTVASAHEADLGLLTASLSALLRFSPYRWLEPHVRLAGDLTRGDFGFTTSEGIKFSDHALSPGASLGAGLRLRTGTITTALGKGLGLAGALIVEGGFHYGAPLSFDLSPPRPSDEKVASDRIPSSPVSIGSLGTSQPYLRISFALLL
jgi:hypothetical protein